MGAVILCTFLVQFVFFFVCLIRAEFVIVPSGGEGIWNWENGRKYCKEEIGTDYYAINTLEKHVEVMVTGHKNGVSSFAWIGLTDEEIEGRWKWVDGSATKEYFNWRRGEVPESDARRNYGRMNFGEFGMGWQAARGGLTYSHLICSRRRLICTLRCELLCFLCFLFVWCPPQATQKKSARQNLTTKPSYRQFEESTRPTKKW